MDKSDPEHRDAEMALVVSESRLASVHRAIHSKARSVRLVGEDEVEKIKREIRVAVEAALDRMEASRTTSDCLPTGGIFGQSYVQDVVAEYACKEFVLVLDARTCDGHTSLKLMPRRQKESQDRCERVTGVIMGIIMMTPMMMILVSSALHAH